MKAIALTGVLSFMLTTAMVANFGAVTIKVDQAKLQDSVSISKWF